jgi:hypothetical protein
MTEGRHDGRMVRASYLSKKIGVIAASQIGTSRWGKNFVIVAPSNNKVECLDCQDFWVSLIFVSKEKS